MVLGYIWQLAGRPVPQDMFSRKIVGWDLADNMRSILVINALSKAIKQRMLPKGLIVHSDGVVGNMHLKSFGIYSKSRSFYKV